MMQPNKSLMTTLAAAALLIGGGILAYLAFPKFKDVPVGTNVIPQETLMAISLTTDEGQWRKLRQFGTPESRANLEQFLNDLRDRILAANGYSYEQDLQPWIGKEITIGFLPNDPATASVNPPPLTAAPPSQVSVVAVLPIANPLKAKELLEKPRPAKQGKIVERVYKDVKIAETQDNFDGNYSFAVLGTNYLLVTNNPDATNRAIDTYKGKDSIAQTPGYTDAISQIKSKVSPFAQIYVNIPVATKIAALNTTRQISPQKLLEVQHNQGLATTVDLMPEGVNFRAISWLKPNSKTKLVAENTAGKMINQLPDNALMMISGSNLQSLWQGYVQGANSNPIAPINPDVLRRNLKANTGLDLDEDLIKWMKGEFTLSFLPALAKDNPNPKFAAGLLFMVKASDRRGADEALKRLDGVMKTKDFKVEDEKIKDNKLVKWTAPFGGYTMTRGWLDGNVAFLSVGAPVVNEIIPKPTSLLGESEQFKDALPTNLESNSGQFFIDLERSLNPKNLALGDLLPPGQKVWMEAIRSIGITTAVVGDRATRYDAFVRIKTTNIPTTTTTPSLSPSPSPVLSPSPASPSPASPSPASPSPASPSPSP